MRIPRSPSPRRSWHRPREWRKETLLVALGLDSSDMTEVPSGAQVITGEAFTLNANRVGVLGARATVAPVIQFGAAVLIPGSDYNIWTDLEGRTVIVGKGATAIAGANLTADYAATSGGIEQYKIGGIRPLRFFAVELFEKLSNGGTRALFIPKAIVTVRGAVDFFADETGGDTAIRIEAVQDPNLEYLVLLENTQPAESDPGLGNSFVIDPGGAGSVYPGGVIYDGGFASSSYAAYQVLDGGGA
jgi:hypothetical protein